MKINQIKYFQNRDIFFYKMFPVDFDIGTDFNLISFEFSFFDENHIVFYKYYKIKYFINEIDVDENTSSQIPIKIKCELIEVKGERDIKLLIFSLVYLRHYGIYVMEMENEAN